MLTTFAKIDIHRPGHAKWDGAAAVDHCGSKEAWCGGTVVFAPYKSDVIGIVDVATGMFSNLTLPMGGSRRFSGAVEVDGAVYFTPHSADVIGKVDVATRTFGRATR